MDNMKLFQFAAIWNPNEEQVKQNAKAKLVVELTTILAKDFQQANMMAARALPIEIMDELDQIEIVVRPF